MIATRKLTTVGNNGQISVGKELAGKEVLVERFPDGRIVISPGTFVPRHLHTFHTPAADRRLAEFDDWSQSNPPNLKANNDLKQKLKTRKRA